MDQDKFVKTFMSFVQQFGLLANDKTPCGEDMSLSEAHALTILRESQPLTQKSLAKRLRLEKSTVSRLIDSMEKKDWITRQHNNQDLRQNHLRLKSSGTERAKQVFQAREEHFRAILNHIPEEEQESLHASLECFLDALHTADQQSPEGRSEP